MSEYTDADLDVPHKKRCEAKDNLDPIFKDFPGYLKKKLALHLFDLCDVYRGPVLNALRFYNCNAADANGGVSFCNAYCSVKPIKKKVFGTVFVAGLTTVSKFLKEGEIPDSIPERFVLSKLLHYMADEETQAILLNLEQYDETDLPIVLANHLTGKLATSSRYVINKHLVKKKEKVRCPCSPDCDFTGVLGDTSIGNEEVWSGPLDIIVNQNVGVGVMEEDEENPSNQGLMIQNCSGLVKSDKLIAQTVVFSFLQKQIHPLSKHNLVPCFGVSSSGLVIYFYESEHDVLLESSYIPFLAPTKSHSGVKVNLTAVLASWFAINCKYLCSGLPDSLKSEDKKADFFTQANEKIGIYRNKLKLGDVGLPVQSSLVGDTVDSGEDSPDELDNIRFKLYKVAYRDKKCGEKCK
ncbi:uncharacterized protein [Argopecten irradians]|uniref:uncharacterized protein n=1 Tax=Argopecten irradians TaxID=31199 RepID=UPI0037122BC0